MSFDSGFAQGRSIVNDAYARALQQQEMAIRQAEADRAAVKFANDQTDRLNEDNAYRDMTGMRTNGVVSGNASGMSNAAAQALNNSGGQALVDETARLGNAEAASLGADALPGMAPQYRVSGQAPTQYGADGQAIGTEAMQGPTLQTRAATPRETLQSMYALAAAKRSGPDVFAALDQQSRALDKEDIYGRVGKMSDADIRDKLPGLNAAEMSGLPIYDAGDVLDAKGNPTGYRELKIVKNGKSEFIQASPSQLRQLATAHALMEGGFAQDGLALLSSVNKDIGDLVTKYNSSLKDAVTTNNSARHERATDENGRITANAAATNARTSADYHGQLTQDLKDQRTRREQAGVIQEKIDALDPTDPAFDAKYRKLVGDFNALNVRNGGTISPSAGRGTGQKSVLQMPVDLKKNDDGTYTAYAKDGGQALYNTINGQKLPLGMELPEYQKLRVDAAKAKVDMQLQENDRGELRYAFVGPSGEPLATVKEAAMSKAPKAAATAPTSPAAAMTGPSRTSTQSPQADRPGNVFTRDVAPALTSSGMDARKSYIQSKLSRGEKLDPSETARAKQYGLIK